MKFFLTVLLILPPLSQAAEKGAPVQQASVAQGVPPATQTNSASSSLDAYAAHLESLMPLVSGCASARDAVACNPAQVGQDDEIVLANGEHRVIRFGWLRALFEKGQKADVVQPAETKPGTEKNNPANKDNPDKTAASKTDTSKSDVKKSDSDNSDADKDEEDEDKPPAPGELLKETLKPRQPLTTELLKNASQRLSSDLAQARALSALAVDPHTREHEVLKQILSESAYRNINTDTAQNRGREKLLEWINQAFEKMNALGASIPWLGQALLIGLIVLLGALLIWALIQSERRMRLRLTPEGGFGPGLGAASARDWQLWLADAEAAAAVGEWREAIHFLYWASISRLESMRLWPADRARTPREYLALLNSQDPRRPGLQRLTRSFERTWYGGRMAEEAEFKAAAEIAKELIAAGGTR
jgi:hypothetical protein